MRECPSYNKPGQADHPCPPHTLEPLAAPSPRPCALPRGPRRRRRRGAAGCRGRALGGHGAVGVLRAGARFPVWDVPAMPSSSRLSNIPIWVDDLVLSHSSAVLSLLTALHRPHRTCDHQALTRQGCRAPATSPPSHTSPEPSCRGPSATPAPGPSLKPGPTDSRGLLPPCFASPGKPAHPPSKAAAGLPHLCLCQSAPAPAAATKSHRPGGFKAVRLQSGLSRFGLW
ncbi:uncharacterized protein [Manis javanica]|uniref:uncharacterized protein isoform X2 n=1 Tax=Manis javanica TaxID=9974 RepID=UPI003C6D0F43